MQRQTLDAISMTRATSFKSRDDVPVSGSPLLPPRSCRIAAVTELKGICGKSSSSRHDDFQSGEAVSHPGVAAELSMDEILEKIQRTIATDGKEESQLADAIRPSTETSRSEGQDEE